MNTKIQELLSQYKDSKNAVFQQRLIPTASPETFLGVRTPQVRQIAMEIYKTPDAEEFLKTLPHTYFDENNLHGALICLMEEFRQTAKALEKFLPYIDNWSVCDMIEPIAFRNQQDNLLPYIQHWLRTRHTYTIRFGIRMLMTHFLEEEFKTEYHDLVANLRSQEYYVNMMIAWYFATALVKQWDETLPYIATPHLAPWTHNKVIQKACESYRISDDRKSLLKGLKVKENEKKKTIPKTKK